MRRLLQVDEFAQQKSPAEGNGAGLFLAICKCGCWRMRNAYLRITFLIG